jgi:hypothetical protein
MNEHEWTTAQFLVAYLVTLVLIGPLDDVWLVWLAKDFYRREMGDLMSPSLRMVPAVVFYITYQLAVVFFALLPVTDSAVEALVRCAACQGAAGVCDLRSDEHEHRARLERFTEPGRHGVGRVRDRGG